MADLETRKVCVGGEELLVVNTWGLEYKKKNKWQPVAEVSGDKVCVGGKKD